VQAVHDKGGKIFYQMYHGGRTSLPDKNGGFTPIGASDIPLPPMGVRK